MRSFEQSTDDHHTLNTLPAWRYLLKVSRFWNHLSQPRASLWTWCYLHTLAESIQVPGTKFSLSGPTNSVWFISRCLYFVPQCLKLNDLKKGRCKKKYVKKYNDCWKLRLQLYTSKIFAQSAGVVEYTDCFSTKG